MTCPKCSFPEGYRHQWCPECREKYNKAKNLKVWPTLMKNKVKLS